MTMYRIGNSFANLLRLLLSEEFLKSLPATIPLGIGSAYSQYLSELKGKEQRAVIEELRNISILLQRKEFAVVNNELQKNNIINTQKNIEQVIESIEGEIDRSSSMHSDPVSFFSGGSATQADIAAGIDVPRTQYVNNWTDENGTIQKSWKELLLTNAKSTQTLRKNKLRIVIVYGHRGSGKETLCKRMVHDLKALSLPVIDLLPDPIAPEHVNGILIQANKEANHLHIFTKIDNTQETIIVQQFLAAIKQLSNSKAALTIYVAIDTNKWKQIEGKLKSIRQFVDCILEDRHLRGRLDEREMNDLILRLKEHRCLIRLEHKSDAMTQCLFRRKAKKGLLTCLIEVTRGTQEGQELNDILWQEYHALSVKAKWAYGLVTLFGSYGIGVPYSVMDRALGELTGDRAYFESNDFNSETSEIVWRWHNATYSSRHKLLAETLIQRFVGVDWDGFKCKIIFVVLNSLELSIPTHRNFFEMVLDRKVFKEIINLEIIIQAVNEKRISTIQGRDISRVFNSIIRIYQSRGKYQEGKVLADESLTHWNHIGNQSSYLRAFCCQKLGETEEVRKVASELVEAMDYPFHVLHGIALLCVLRDWKSADKALNAFNMAMGGDTFLYLEYQYLRKEVNVWLSVSLAPLSDADMTSLKPSIVVEKIQQQFVERDADEKTIVDLYKQITHRAHDYFGGYFSFFSYLHRHCHKEEDKDVILQRYLILQQECEHCLNQHDQHYRNYPNNVRSLLHSNLARTLFKRDYILKNGYQQKEVCDKHFSKGINLKKDNWYAYNWYGTFLKEAKKDRESAKEYYKRSVKGDENNPIFKYNLALLYYEAPIFSRKNLENSRMLVIKAISLCKEGSNFEDFSDYPTKLLSGISQLMARTDLKEGDQLETDESLQVDAE